MSKRANGIMENKCRVEQQFLPRHCGVSLNYYPTTTPKRIAKEDAELPARDKYHEVVKQALVHDGWTITHDPYRLSIGLRRAYIDLGAEMPIGAEKSGRFIAVEIKSFLGLSELDDLENALGQFGVYQVALRKRDPNRILYLALPDDIRGMLLDESDFRDILRAFNARLIFFDPKMEAITKWIETIPTEPL